MKTLLHKAEITGARKTLNTEALAEPMCQAYPAMSVAPTARPTQFFQSCAIAAMLGFAPVFSMMLSWDLRATPDDIFTVLVKLLALPVVVAELAIIGIAVRAGLCRQAWRPSRLQVFALSGLTMTIGYATLVAAPNLALAVLATTILFIHFVLALSVRHLCREGILWRGHLTSSILWGFATATGALTLFVALVGNTAQFDWMHDLPAYDNIRRAGYYAAAVAGLCMGRLTILPPSVSRTATFAVAVLAFGTIFWTGARGAAAACVGAYAISAVLFPAARQVRTTGLIVISALVGAVLASSAGMQLSYMGTARMVQITAPVPSDPSTGFLSGRSQLWRQAINAIEERPIFGHGEGQAFAVLPAAEAGGSFHPHNILLQTLLAWGIAGTVLLVILAAPWAWNIVQYARKDAGERLPPIIAMLVLFLYSAVDGTLFHVQSLALFAACAGLAHAQRHRVDSSHEPHSKEDLRSVFPARFDPRQR